MMVRIVLFLTILVGVVACVATQSTIDRGPDLVLRYPGTTKFIDYTKYGKFVGIGTSRYRYILKDRAALIDALGEGIYPSSSLVYKNPQFQKMSREGKLAGGHWKHINSGQPAIDYYSWASEGEEPGVKLFFTAEALRMAGQYVHALKAYQAITVFFPGSAAWAPKKAFVWYVSTVALGRIDYICRTQPQLGVKFVGGKIYIENRFDTNLKNDKVFVTPGRFVPWKWNKKKTDLNKLRVVAQRGKGKVFLRKFSNGHWQMYVDGKPFTIKGITYSPTKIGESPHNGSLQNWQFMDENGNGVLDLHEVWVDKNQDNIRDKNEVRTSDFKLLQDMGCNAIRYYHIPPNNQYNSKKQFNKKLLREMYHKHGIRVVMGDFIGAYTIGSGASWQTGTDYTDKKQVESMLSNLRQLVLDHKDEPYLLMWVLGNENNMPSSHLGINATRTLASKNPVAYAKFLNRCAKMIHKLDPDHPVAVGNLDLIMVKYYQKYAPALDILGLNAYRGSTGFGRLWSEAKRVFDRPVLITEYGCDSWDSRRMTRDEPGQMGYHKGSWEDIVYNLAGGQGVGNAIGGVVFEYLDEWWKSLKGPADEQQNTKDCSMAFPDGWSSEEHLGIVGQGGGMHSPYLRRLKSSYFYYQRAWRK